MVKISSRGIAKLRYLIKDVQYLYLRLDREIQRHLVHLVNSLLDSNIFEKEVAQLAYIIYVFENLLRILKSLIRTPYASSQCSLYLSSILNDNNPMFLLQSLSFSTLYKNIIVTRIPEISYNLPQYIILKSIIIELRKILYKIFNSINKLIHYQPWLEDIKDIVSRIINLLNNILTKTFLACVKYVPMDIARHLVQQIHTSNIKHLIKELINYLRILESIQITLSGLEKSMKKKENFIKYSYIINASRLYEIYVLLLLLTILNRRYKFNGIIEHCDATCFYFTDSPGTIHIKIAYNQRNSLIEKSRLIRVLKILCNRENYLDNILKYTGIPDIVLYVCSNNTNMHVIFECKYRFNISAIVESRFKVLGYLLEYDINSAVLVFPRVIFSKKSITDGEVNANHILIREACDNGVIMEYNGKLGKYLYLICIDPEDIDNGIYVLEKVLKLLGIIQ